MNDPLSLPALLALIEEATPGEWRQPHRRRNSLIICGPDADYLGETESAADARYIAAADPPTVRVLIEALQEAVEALEEIGEMKCRALRNCGDRSCPDEYKDRINWCAACIATERTASLREAVTLDPKEPKP